MKEKWFQKNKQADFALLAREARISEVTARVIVNRGIHNMKDFWQYVQPELSGISDPFLMKDMERAVCLLVEGLRTGKHIRIVGDYDVDGVMSTYILIQGLMQTAKILSSDSKDEILRKQDTVAQIDYEIPDRILDGYGINVSILNQAAADGVDIVLTCDNGIAAAEQIAHGKKLGMTIIVTDHHDIPFSPSISVSPALQTHDEILPPADAIVNPKQQACRYPFKGLCGAGIAWQLVRALYQQTGISVTAAEELLDAVALATVCDVMDLLSENRILVKYGLLQLSNTKNAGLRALLRVTGMEGCELTAYHCGFVIGPCINASGRLESAKKGLRLLLSKDTKEISQLAGELLSLNEERKTMTANGVDEATLIAQSYLKRGDTVLVIYLPDCHESIAGIIAGRIRERFYRPTLILTTGEEQIKGSGRSIPEYNMFEHLSACRKHFSKFGGHPLAAGFSLNGLQEELVEKLRHDLNEQSQLTENDLLPKVSFDQVLPFSSVTENLIKEFELLAPFGKGNPKPLFALRNVIVRQARILGKNRNAIRLCLRESGANGSAKIGQEYSGILFEDADIFLSNMEEKFGHELTNRLFSGGTTQVKLDLVFCPEINEYQGHRNIQLAIEHYR